MILKKPLVKISRLPFTLTFFMICFSGYVQAQNDIAIGTWRTHFSYYSAANVAAAGNKIYCASENGFFVYDTEEQSTTIISKVNGLSDTGIGSLAYNPFNNILILGYTNGNIDLLEDTEISNFDVIKEADLSGSKAINGIHFSENTAYLSTDLGLVVFNMERNEISETYTNIGPNGTPMIAFNSTVFRDSLFIASDLGILAASLDNSVNRLDFRNWRSFDNSPGLPTGPIKVINTLQGKLYTAVDNDSIYDYAGEEWEPLSSIGDHAVQSSWNNEGELFIVLDSKLLKISSTNDVTEIANNNIIAPKALVTGDSGELWVADSKNGLLNVSVAGFDPIIPQGPFSDQVVRMRGYNRKIVVVPGGLENDLPSGNTDGFFVFENGSWINYNRSGLRNTINIPEAFDLIDIAYDPNSGLTYFASFGYGLLSWDNVDGFSIINENTPGSTLVNSNPSGHLTRVSSLSVDFDGNLWLCNYATDNPLQVLRSDGTWESFQPSGSVARFTEEIIVPASGNKWLKVDPDKGGTIILYDDATNSTSRISRNANEGQITSNLVNDMLEDLNGQIWLGSAGGISYFPSSFELLESDPKNFAIRPFFEGFPLLADESITSIENDGGNRKWIGTDDGIWLFSETGESQVFRFTVDNSPLPSNEIIDIEIDGESGEVFIATQKGIVSFRGTATAGTRTHRQVKVFPNPVTRDFSGTIGISGLANNAIIKITDVAGKLIFETQAQGGTATWDGRDYNGRRATTGIYLILSSDSSGEETFVGKIAVID